MADGARVRVLSADGSDRLIPSVVSFTPEGAILVGEQARQRRLEDVDHTVYSVKRLIGRPFDSPEVRRTRQRFAFELIERQGGGVGVQVRGEVYTLTEISAFVLREVRRVAEQVLGEPCERAVVTVPANFNELQRSATKAAGKVAGLEILRIINEPTAAALAYGYGQDRKERVVVYDFGGGTFDVTILELDGDVFEVVSTAGDTFLGGDDIDLALAEVLADAFMDRYQIDPREDFLAFERLRTAAEDAKVRLSADEVVDVRIAEVMRDGKRPLGLAYRLTRGELEAVAEPLVRRSLEVCDQALADADTAATLLDNVILVGGSTRMPLIRSMVQAHFGHEAHVRIDPDLVVAQGAAIHAHALGGGPTLESAPPPAQRPASDTAAASPPSGDGSVVESLDLDEVLILDEPDDDAKDSVVIDPGYAAVAESMAPGQLEQRDDGLDIDLQPPDDLPAELDDAPPAEPAEGERWMSGPAPKRRDDTEIDLMLQDAMAPSSRPPREDATEVDLKLPTMQAAPLLLDVTPQSLGLETAGGFCSHLIARNAPIPAEQTRTFSTARDDQDTVVVRVCQGESRSFDENQVLGEVELSGLRRAPRGAVRVDISFRLDADGSLEVEATDSDTGQVQAIRIQLLGGESEADVAAMRDRQEAMVS
ncbi:MAG: Hsp70 family protein [Myxococcota bacterium]